MGVEVTLAPVPFEEPVKRPPGTARVQRPPGGSQPFPFARPRSVSFLGPGPGNRRQNYTQWENRIASGYLEQARVTVNQQERAKFYRNFQILFNQELPALPLFYPVYSYAVDRDIQGVRVGPLFDTSDRFANVTEWFLTGRQSQKTR